ncbi:MAG: bifunctional UDP-N-acetylmuramoyl-tripeptide:D-alanyl-D-alanine ligase/alanine racemase [Bacteroidales bacterium]|nr:bifunctional UDP-N-acetylmuramoyl-tripeptide:D-alanyl-D-alanine ligase/alanine racemase [Bacteroidales bacterium]
MPNIQEISTQLKAISRWLPFPNLQISELLYDSRRLLMPSKTLFFAIKTEKHDGHDYIVELINEGVRNFVITEDVAQWKSFAECNFIRVRDCVTALQQVAAAHRQSFDIPVIGITGSNGKTIVKEWLTDMLTDDFHLIASPNSYNSQIGVPFSVWQMRPHHNLAIFEAGISLPGEMQHLADIIRPTIGILTNIGTAHSQFFKDENEKLKEKLLLFKKCKTIIYCNDNPLIENELQNKSFSKIQKLSWGRNARAHFQINKEMVENHQTVVTINEQDFSIPFVDAASVENALHTIILLLHLNFQPTQINEKLSHLTPIMMRMEVKEAVNQSVVINDTYSLDFNSLRVALDFVKSQIRYEKKSVVLSDFAQVGKLSEDDYLEINHLLQTNGITRLIGVGQDLFVHSRLFTAATQTFFRTTEELLQALPTMDFQQEAILVKGARSFRFERVVEALRLRTHRTVLNVSLPAIVNNLAYYRSKLAPSTKMVAMVKAQCYGLGDVELINELQYHHIDYLAVAYTDEGVNLRKKNIKLPIIVLGAEGESFEMMIDYGLEPEIFNFYSLQECEKALAKHPEIQNFKIHIKFDTGMHRLGFRKEEIPALAAALRKNPQLRVASAFSHLAAAEDASEDTFTRSQIKYFQEATTALEAELGYRFLRHIDNSAGISRFPQAHMEMVRLGIGLYGFSSVPEDQPHLQHVATLKTIITHIEQIDKGDTVGYNRTFEAADATRVGIIPIGYADGFPPELGRGVGSVVVNGKKVPIIGKICMDMTMIDLSGVEASEGDEVIVYGDDNRIDEIAAKIGKIPYHLLTAISKRVQRVYVME